MRLAQKLLALMLLLALSNAVLGLGQSTGQQVAARVSPQRLDFGEVEIGKGTSAKKSLTFTIENTGDVALNLQFDNPSSPFSVVSRRTSALNPDQQVTVTVEFSPKEGGIFSDAVIITDRNYPRLLLIVHLRGEGQEPTINLDKTFLDFGAIEAAPDSVSSSSSTRSSSRDSKALTFKIKNVGKAPLTGTISFSSTAFFLGKFSNRDLPVTTQTQRFDQNFNIKENGTETFTITFIPPKSGDFKTTVSVRSNDPDNSSLRLMLEGVGTAPEVDVNPTSLRFRDVTIASSSRNRSTTDETKAITIENTGDQTLRFTIESLCDEFTTSRSSSRNGSSVEPNASTTISITFKPRQVGTYTCTLLVQTNDPENPIVRVTLSGKALAAANNNAQMLGAPSAMTGSSRTGFVFAVASTDVASVHVQVFDLNGAMVFQGSAAGRALSWTGTSSFGAPLPNGVYLVSVQGLQAQRNIVHQEIRKIAVLR